MARSIEELLSRGIAKEGDTIKSALDSVDLCGPNDGDTDFMINLSVDETVALVTHFFAQGSSISTKGKTVVDRAMKRIAYQIKAVEKYDEVEAVATGLSQTQGTQGTDDTPDTE